MRDIFNLLLKFLRIVSVCVLRGPRRKRRLELILTTVVQKCIGNSNGFSLDETTDQAWTKVSMNQNVVTETLDEYEHSPLPYYHFSNSDETTIVVELMGLDTKWTSGVPFFSRLPK